MGLIQKYKNWKTGKRLNRLEEDLKLIRNRISFNPKYAYDIDGLDTPQSYTRRLEEYRVWYIGSNRALRQLYFKNIKTDSLNYFWYKAPVNYRMLHTGIPGLISTKMATIIFGGGYNLDAKVYNDANEELEDESQKAKELINGLRLKCNIDERFENAAQSESWAGHVFFKFSHDVNLSEYPILEIADPRKAEAIKVRGITKAIVFKYWYSHKSTEYRLDEIYTTNEDGFATIRYELYRLDSKGETKLELDAIEETYSLKYDEEGNQRLNNNDEFVYDGIKGMLAFDKPNKLPSHEFMDSYYGASDYEGGLDSFDALDETYSELIKELRDNKAIRYIPKTLLPKRQYTDSSGNTHIETLLPDEFVSNYQKIEGDQDQKAKNEINIKQIPDKTNDHLNKYKTALTTAINIAEISPLALGITGLEAINSSDKSQQERNKATLELRSKKLKLWKPVIEKIYMALIELNSWMVKKLSVKQEGFATQDLNFGNTDIKITFNDYIIEKVNDKINTWGNAKMQKVSSTKEAIKNIHPDWTDEEIDEEVNLIRYEEGMSLDNPNNLPELTGVEQEEEMEEVIEEGEEDEAA